MSSEQIPEGRAWIGITRSSALALANEIAPQQNNIGIVVVYFPTEANIHIIHSWMIIWPGPLWTLSQNN